MQLKSFLLLVVFALVACGEKVDDEKSRNASVNKWIYESMEGLYYWNDQLPSFQKSYDAPYSYFNSLLSEEDRFSAFYQDYEELMKRLSGVRSAEPGFDYKLFLEEINSNKVIVVVTYTKPGTHARQMGIKRGDVINKINDTPITVENYQFLLSSFSNESASVKLGLAEFVNDVYIDKSELIVQKSFNYSEHPVLLDSVYIIGDKKIGYLIYNFFTNDAGDGSLRFDLDLNETMAKFQSQSINELVVDLRYNSGGSMSSAIRLGSMLVPDRTEKMIFSYTEYNKYITDYFNSAEYKKKYPQNPFEEYFTSAIENKAISVPLNNISSNLQGIYFLTGKSTASASEMVINGLKPYINCVLIGEQTVGKNVGSVVVDDKENSDNKNAIMPIVLKYFNKDRKSDFSYGFVPDVIVRDDFSNFLGDTSEALLATAIEQITGTARASKVRAEELSRPLFPVPLSKDFPLLILDKDFQVH
jgi:carboxyl-terminal processing protease